MLSRIAESLFWVGRYVERAEGTARILDVHVHHLVEAVADEEAACRSLVDVMGLEQPGGLVNVRRMTDLLAFDAENTSSIVSSLQYARENARGVRESLSAEMWECLNATWHALPDPIEQFAGVGAHDFFRFVKERAALFAGLTDATMSRDDTWRFIVLGRSVERVDMTCRLLGSRASDTRAADCVILLTSCSAHESFLRTHQREVTPDLVVEFLLLDRLFPRSVVHALTTAEQCLGELDPGGQRGRQQDARRILGQARAALEYEPLTSLLADVETRLEALQAACSAATDALATQYFRRAESSPWKTGGLREVAS